MDALLPLRTVLVLMNEEQEGRQCGEVKGRPLNAQPFISCLSHTNNLLHASHQVAGEGV